MTTSPKFTIKNPSFNTDGADPKITLTVKATVDRFPGTMHHPKDLMNIIAQSAYVESVTLEPTLEIRVGGTYLNGRMDQVKIVGTEDREGVTHYIGSDGFHYRFDGTYSFESNERSMMDLVTLVHEDFIRLKFASYRRDQMAYGLVTFRQSDSEKKSGQFDPHAMFAHLDADIEDPAVQTKVEMDCAALARLLNKFKIDPSCLTNQVVACAVPADEPLNQVDINPDNIMELTRQMEVIYDADKDYERAFADLPEEEKAAYNVLRDKRSKISADTDASASKVNEEAPNPRSEAYLKGWADASALQLRNNTYPTGSDEYVDYDYGYTMSMVENG